MKKKKLVRLVLIDGNYAYGVILDKTFMTFFDFITKDKNIDSKNVIKKPILFTNAVSYKVALKSKEWEVVDELEIGDDLLEKKPYYIQDNFDSNLFFLSYPPNYDKMEKTTKKECLGIEKMLVYYPEHVVDRLNNHFFNTEIKWVNSLPFWLDYPTKQSL